jgi:hypothetical protein
MSLQTRLPDLQEQLELRISQCEGGQKNHAWWMAQELARLVPDLYSELPQMLKLAMLSRSCEASETATKQQVEA